MKRAFMMGGVGMATLLLVLVGCQTAKPALIAPADSAIQAEGSGFAPGGATGLTSIDISVLYGNSDSIKSWKIELVSGGTAHKSWTGDATYLPASLTWDGKDDSAAIAPEGKYTAKLSIEYTAKYQPVSVESGEFVLDSAAPTGALAMDPPQFVPADTGVVQPMKITINASSAVAKMDNWKLDVFDIAGGLVRSFSDQWPNTSVTWDGSSLNSGFVSPAVTYKAVATVRDEYGLTAEIKADIPVSDIPLAANQDVIMVSSSGFSPRSASTPTSINFALTFGNKQAVKTWKVTVLQAQSGAQRSWSGDSSNLPMNLSWDGVTDGGVLAPEGSYAAILSIDYGKSFKPSLVRTKSFVLDITPPSVNVSGSPAVLAPNGTGGILPVKFSLYGSSLTAGLKSWSLGILDAGGKQVTTFNGSWPASGVTWDGKLVGGGTADPTRSYAYVAAIQDEYGNSGQSRGALAMGELPTVQGGIAITAQTPGFSPNADQVADTIAFSLNYGQPAAVSAWKVEIGSASTNVIRTYSGDGNTLPASLGWDGKAENGSMAPDGSYTATLSVAFGTILSPASAHSTPFVLDTTPPTGSIGLSSPLFSPIEGADTLTLTVAARSPLAAIDSWNMDIYDPGGNIFRTFTGKWPNSTVVWDGKDAGGELVQSAEDYPVVVRIRDQFGNVGTVKSVVPVDILVEKISTGYRILASRIFFKAFTADYRDVAPDLAQQNMARLDALAAKLKKFAGYKIKIVGHAVMINWNKPAEGREEQKAILIPLSKARAAAVEAALVERGLDAARFATEGVGAADQLVPDSDYKDRWQNRRVALFLEKE